MMKKTLFIIVVTTCDLLNAADVIDYQSFYGAIKRNCIEEVTAFLKQDIDINYKNGLNCTPLYLATSCGHIELVRLFLKRGARINEKNGPNNSTPLHVAARHRNEEMIRLLHEWGAKIDAVDSSGRTVEDIWNLGDIKELGNA